MAARSVIGALAVFAACQSTTRTAANADRGAAQPRVLLERLRQLNGFSFGAHVVWTPMWPRPEDQLVMIYDLESERAALRGAKSLEWVLQPHHGEAVAFPMNVANGVAVLKMPLAKLAAGQFTFRDGARVDDGCSDPSGFPVVPGLPDWRTQESEHFYFRWLSHDAIENQVDEILARLERQRSVIIAKAGLVTVPTEKITVARYPDLDTTFSFEARHGSHTHFGRNRIVSVGPNAADARELARLLLFHDVGQHYGFFDEGAALYFGDELAAEPSSPSCDASVRLASPQRPALGSILTQQRFFAAPTQTLERVYLPAACSFVKYLVTRYGDARFRLFLRSIDCTSQNDAARIAISFEDAFGASLEAGEQAWRLSLLRK